MIKINANRVSLLQGANIALVLRHAPSVCPTSWNNRVDASNAKHYYQIALNVPVLINAKLAFKITFSNKMLALLVNNWFKIVIRAQMMVNLVLNVLMDFSVRIIFVLLAVLSTQSVKNVRMMENAKNAKMAVLSMGLLALFVQIIANYVLLLKLATLVFQGISLTVLLVWLVVAR